jgi:hypothetical protein
MLKRIFCLWGVSVACLLGSACGEEDLTSIRLSLREDGSGTITVVSVEAPAEGAAVEGAVSGVTWKKRVSVNAAAGDFADPSRLKVADISFDWGVGDGGMGRLRVMVPLGADRRWVRTIAPIPEDQRSELAETFDPTGKIKTISASVRIVVELPRDVVSSGAAPAGRGITASHKKNTATLTVPVDLKAARDESAHWHITWQQ